MKLHNSLFLLLLLVSFLFTDAQSQSTPSAGTGSVKYPCDAKCDVRCSKAGYRKRCLRDCSICCNICKCVPPGTYGNKAVCPCYNNLLNSKGKQKCP